jgi:hypothetical protein
MHGDNCLFQVHISGYCPPHPGNIFLPTNVILLVNLYQGQHSASIFTKNVRLTNDRSVTRRKYETQKKRMGSCMSLLSRGTAE